MDTANQEQFPPPGWVTNREAARMLGVGLDTMTQSNFKWRPWLKRVAKCVRVPVSGGRINIYPMAELHAILAAREEAAKPPIPEGFLDKDGACAFFGVTWLVWKHWIEAGKVRCGKRLSGKFPGGKRTVYAIADLERLREELLADGKWYTRQHAPPYPDPQRPGVYRVPLSGWDIQQREAIIDAESLPLLEGRSCHWSTGGAAREVGSVLVWSPDGSRGALRRIIMGVAETNSNVRHLNGDPLDCRRENLVVRTVQQRTRNMRKARAIKGRPTSSRFKGVHWQQSMKRWYAKIRFQGKDRMLGKFTDEIAAAVAYDEAASQWFGEHARLNFPHGVDAWLEAQAQGAERAEAA
jgi:hypothetical protein